MANWSILKKVLVFGGGGFLALIILAGAFGSSEKTTNTTTQVKEVKKPDCGFAMTIPEDDGIAVGAKMYLNIDVEGGHPYVNLAGSGVSCSNLLALVHAYTTLKGPPLLGWLDKNGWRWLNIEDDAASKSLFKTEGSNSYDVFVGAGKGKNSQVGFLN